MATHALKTQEAGLSPYVLALRQALAEGSGRRIARFSAGELEIEIRAMADSLWALIRRDGEGGLYESENNAMLGYRFEHATLAVGYFRDIVYHGGGAAIE